MAYAASWDELMKNIKTKTTVVLKEDVFPVVREVIRDHVIDDVYVPGDGKYRGYWGQTRRENNGGLTDDNNYKCRMVGSGKMLVMNIAQSQEPILYNAGSEINFDSEEYKTSFSKMINNGLCFDLTHYFKTGERKLRKARPFITNAQNEINSDPSYILAALKIGLEKRR